MRTLKADLSDDAFEGWNRWIDRHGLTTASLLESIGLELLENPVWQDDAALPLPTIQIIERARAIGAERRRRR